LPDDTAGRSEGTADDLASRAERARALHTRLVRCARSQSQIDRAIGHALRRFKELDGVPRLGYARFADYARERLGFTARWALELIRLDRALSDLPALAHAHRRGDVTTAKVLVLLPVLTPETEADWVPRARELSVRALKEAVSAAAHAGSSHAADARAAGSDEDIDASEGAWVCIGTPSAVAHLYDHAIEIARRSAGSQAPVHRCVEHMLGEFLAGPARVAPPRPPGSLEAGAAEAAPGGRSGPGSVDAASPPPAIDATAAREAAHECAANGWSPLRDQPERGSLPLQPIEDAVPPDATKLDAHLRHLTRRRQTRHGEMARGLREFKEARLWQELSFASFQHYCREMLGICPRFAQQLIHADRRFCELPQIGTAYYGGTLSWGKTRLLLSVCRRDTQAAWLQRAKQVTVRYLELEVAHGRRRREVDPDAWGRDGTPLPPSHVPPYAESSAVRPGVGLWESFGPTRGAHAAAGEGAHTASKDHPHAVAGDGAHTFSHDDPRELARLGVRLPCTVRFWLPDDVHVLWRRVDAQIAAAAGRTTVPWQRLLALLEHFLRQWDVPDEGRFLVLHRILARDGYQCAVPGCLVRRGLERHHVVFRSRQGPDSPENVVTVCAVHHRIGIHGGWVRCEGTAPDALTWRLPVGVYRGDVRSCTGR
jgi:hypothetical protein